MKELEANLLANLLLGWGNIILVYLRVFFVSPAFVCPTFIYRELCIAHKLIIISLYYYYKQPRHARAIIYIFYLIRLNQILMKTRKSSDKFNFMHIYFSCHIHLAPGGCLNIIVTYDETFE